MKKLYCNSIMIIFLVACGRRVTIPVTGPISNTQIPEATIIPTQTQQSVDTPSAIPSLIITPAPDFWKTLPVVPVVSPQMVEVYQRGLALGRKTNRFSKIGDCQNITTYFLAAFDDPNAYSLGSEYAYLLPTINHFSGSWSRQSIAVKGGMNVAAVQNPYWTLTPKPAECKSGETPLDCEIRVNNPSIVIISMEESWTGDIGKYDLYLRKIVKDVLSLEIVPILATRAEVSNPKISINATVARIAYDYNLPLWNFWAASYPLPSHGLTGDGFHLTWAGPFFDDKVRMQMAWPWRNLTALQAVDTVYRAVIKQP